jgi:hypothetical protein
VTQTNLLEMPRRTHDYVNDFNDWWKSLGPLRNGSKRKSEKAWSEMSADQRRVLIANTPSWVRFYMNTDQYPPHATTWLNGGSWEDPAYGYEDWISQPCEQCERIELRVTSANIATCDSCGRQQYIRGGNE